MLKLKTRTAFVFLLLAGSFAIAQVNQPVTSSLVNVKAKVIVAGAESETPGEVADGSNMQQLPETMMSPAALPATALDTSSELVEQAGNTVMAAGSCTVVDLFVRQYCASNPDDISCQFQ